MRNKILFCIVLFLVPFAVISFKKDKTNFYLQENHKKSQDIIVKIKNSETNEIKELPLEEYIVGVVASEMPASFCDEALKAQAVAARSYAIYKILNNKKDYDLVTGVTNQGYIDENKMKDKWQDEYNKYYSKIKKAVNDTKGEILYYNDEVVEAFYFSMSNGFTEEGSLVFKEEPYLKSVESNWDNENIRGFRKDKIISKNEFCSLLKINCETIEIGNIIRSSSNRVNKIFINGKEFTGTEIRKILTLRSTDFFITVDPNNIIITTFGYGHGVGMSQYGANGMAKEGYKYDDILRHYYNDVKISRINV